MEDIERRTRLNERPGTTPPLSEVYFRCIDRMKMIPLNHWHIALRI